MKHALDSVARCIFAYLLLAGQAHAATREVWSVEAPHIGGGSRVTQLVALDKGGCAAVVDRYGVVAASVFWLDKNGSNLVTYATGRPPSDINIIAATDKDVVYTVYWSGMWQLNRLSRESSQVTHTVITNSAGWVVATSNNVGVSKYTTKKGFFAMKRNLSTQRDWITYYTYK